MNDVEYFIELHRREDRRMQAIIDVIAFAVLASGYGVWRLARWIIGW